MSVVIGIIPARYASTRLPGKPLVDIGGKSMIQRVYEQALKCKTLSKVIVATDDERIDSHIKGFGGNVVMTNVNHTSGTDRCAEVLAKEKRKPDIVINIQGDEPFIDPEQINLLISCFDEQQAEIATLVKKITLETDIQNPNMVKALRDINGKAIYFSRSPVPYRRNQGAEITYYKHIGIYGYRSDVLLQITKLEPSNLEQAESLEQLRWIENGYTIYTRETQLETLAVDTPDDLKKAIALA